MKGMLIDSVLAGCLTHVERAPEGSNQSGAASVLGLHPMGGPAAIAGLVRAVVVNPVNRVFWRRAPAHIGKEAFEPRKVAFSIKPPFRNGDPATSVTSIVCIARIEAAVLHLAESAVFRAYRIPPCFAVKDA